MRNGERDWSTMLGLEYFELSSWGALRKRGDWVVRGGRENGFGMSRIMRACLFASV